MTPKDGTRLFKKWGNFIRFKRIHS
jgi:hypothetical protein